MIHFFMEGSKDEPLLKVWPISSYSWFLSPYPQEHAQFTNESSFQFSKLNKTDH